MNYLIDLIHEDCNRILDKPYNSDQKDITVPDKQAAEKKWLEYKSRNNSINVDLMTG